MQLQDQQANGDWEDVSQERTAWFLDGCVEFNADIENHAQAIEAMTQGRKLRNDRSDWYSNCRMVEPQDEVATLPAVNRGRRCPKCGGHGRFTTVGHLCCDDCV